MSNYPKVSEGIFDTVKSNTEQFLEIVGQYFPEAIKDGEVDFTALKEEMGEFSEVGAEHYSFTWAGKQAAKKEAQADILGKTLRFKPEDSVNADTTENIYIEGDNLEALKLLKKNYYGKIKMIYIDPPYNTGNDFVYRDDFTMSEEELAELSGDAISGERLQKNNKDSARYHTNWLNMMYPRLKLARELLRDDGVIVISIDDNEQENLKKLCNEIFCEYNFVAMLTVIVKTEGRRYGYFAKTHENVYVYAKNIELINLNEIEVEGTKFNYSDEIGGFNTTDLRNQNARAFNSKNRPNLRYPFYVDEKNPDKDGFCKVSVEPQEGYKEVWAITVNGNESVWRWGKDTAKKELHNLTSRLSHDGEFRIYQKYRKLTQTAKTVWAEKDFISNKGTKELQALLGMGIFDFPKPLALMQRLVTICTNENDIILDFFSGSATTAHAVMLLNTEKSEDGKRTFIMVQLPEKIDEKSEAYTENYKTICEIGKERIRRAAKKIHEDNPDAVFDDGFKVFEVADTNIRWNKINDQDIFDMDYSKGEKDNIDFMPGVNDIDIVYEIMLKQYGIPLSTPIEKLSDISDRTYIFADAVVVCLDADITDELIEKLAAIEPIPAKYILRDSAFDDDIEFKDVSYRRLSALIANHQTDEEKKSKYNNFTVEFI